MPELGERATRAFEDDRLVHGRSGLRTHRVLLRARHRGRGARRARRGGARHRPRGPAPAHPGHQWALSGLLLRRGHRGPAGSSGDRVTRTVVPVDALVVGAGPAGLAAATALRAGGAGHVMVLDREDEAGGTPRLCEHTGFGLRDLRRVLSGPAYARRWVERAAASGVDIRTRSMVTAWAGPVRAEVTGPDGLLEVDARAVVLATGARERPRAARLVPGTRPSGIFTTGQLQQWVHRQRLPLAGRALIVGAEHVSYSAVLTLREAGVQPGRAGHRPAAHADVPLLRPRDPCRPPRPGVDADIRHRSDRARPRGRGARPRPRRHRTHGGASMSSCSPGTSSPTTSWPDWRTSLWTPARRAPPVTSTAPRALPGSSPPATSSTPPRRRTWRRDAPVGRPRRRRVAARR